jgi:hypothetical protein
MGTRARLISSVILCSALAQIMTSAELRADDDWNWTPASSDEAAKAWIPAKGQLDLALTIAFPAERRCYTATLMLTDSEGRVLPSKRVTLMADEEQFVLDPTPSRVVGVYEAPPPVFHALKRSRALRLATPDAEYVFSLAGSATAINSAWKACNAEVQAEKTNDANTKETADPATRAGGIATDSVDGDSVAGMADGVPGESPISGTSVRRLILTIIVLMFAIGNAFLTLDLIAKTYSLPPLSLPAGGQWRRGAVLVGAFGWIVLPLMVYTAHGLPGAALAVAGYLTAGLTIATVMKPAVAQYATGRAIDWVSELRLRGKGERSGSRLIVDGYRRIARQQALAPTEKTTDAEILKLFERVGSAFKSVAYRRREYLKAPRVNYIVWKFLQVHEALNNDAFDAYLQQELRKYNDEGLPADYRNELKL